MSEKIEFLGSAEFDGFLDFYFGGYQYYPQQLVDWLTEKILARDKETFQAGFKRGLAEGKEVGDD